MINSPFLTHRGSPLGTATMPQPATEPISYLYNQDFSALPNGTNMTDQGYTHTQFSGGGGSFVVGADGYANISAASWTGTWGLDAGAAWTNYWAEWDIPTITTRVVLGVRYGAVGTYILQYIPGSEIRLKKSLIDYPNGDTQIADWDSEVPVTQASCIKVQCVGTNITVWMDDVLIGTHSDATYSAGSICVGTLGAGWKTSAIRVFDLS